MSDKVVGEKHPSKARVGSKGMDSANAAMLEHETNHDSRLTPMQFLGQLEKRIKLKTAGLSGSPASRTQALQFSSSYLFSLFSLKHQSIS